MASLVSLRHRTSPKLNATNNCYYLRKAYDNMESAISRNLIMGDYQYNDLFNGPTLYRVAEHVASIMHPCGGAILLRQVLQYMKMLRPVSAVEPSHPRTFFLPQHSAASRERDPNFDYENETAKALALCADLQGPMSHAWVDIEY